MRLYEGSVVDFKEDVVTNKITDKISDRFEKYYKRTVSPSEYTSWNNSLNFLKNSLDFSDLKDNRLIIEYELPYSTRRIDVLIFGKDSKNSDSMVLMELKQWSEVEDCDVDGNVITFIAGSKRQVAHPSLQVQGYHYDLKDFMLVFEEKPPIELKSCAYCHNYLKEKNDVLYAPKFEKYIKEFPVFSREDVEDLGKFLKARLKNGHGLDVFNRFILSPIRPSKKLLDYTKEMINRQKVFTLIDDQITAYNAIIDRACKLASLGKKSVIVVKGGPGTGKSVIALEAMAELMRRGKIVFHATGSAAFTKTLRKILGRRLQNLFKFFFSFTQLKENEIDILVCDEAHRIRKDSGDYGVPAHLRSQRPQIEDLIRPAKLSIFFIDEHQIVRPKEIGSVGLIKSTAEKFNAECFEFELTTQFRCSGSDSFLLWLDDILAIRNTGKKYLTSGDRMELKILDSPLELKRAIDEKNDLNPNSARIVAGYCWTWSKPRPDGSLVEDVVIGDFKMPWEQKDDFWKWATDSSGMHQVGTVYTAQGFEFDYIGVIFADDLAFNPETKQWIAKPDNSFDNMVTRNNQNILRHFQNVYRVLMSRAHKGCYVYFMNKETEAYFRSRIKLDQAMEDKKFIDKIEQEINDNLKYKEYLPVYSLEAVATSFGKEEHVERLGWMKVTINKKLDKDMFIAKVVGKSMGSTIPDGSYCVFRFERGGSRNGLIVLAESRLVADPETNQRFTIKRYKSEKEYLDDGTWKHKKIILSPDNKEFDDIVLEEVQENDFSVVAEFVQVI